MTYLDHGIQVITDDDEIDIAWYLFDDEFVRNNPERTAFLLRKNWKLPDEMKKRGIIPEIDTVVELNSDGDSEKGAVYCVFLSAIDGVTIDDITGSFRFSGVRLPAFSDFLKNKEVPVSMKDWGSVTADWPEELILTRALLKISPESNFVDLFTPKDTFVSTGRWSSARSVSDLSFSAENPKFLTGDREACVLDFEKLRLFSEELQREDHSLWRYQQRPPLIQSSPHMCQIRFLGQFATKPEHEVETIDDMMIYIFFDDLWIAANPDLAKSILHYSSGWQALYKAPPGSRYGY